MFKKLGSKGLLSTSSMTAIDDKYENIIWYRKRWFIVLTILFFIPATLLIAATGDIYAESEGAVYRLTEEMKKKVIIVSIIFMIYLLARALIPVLIQPSL